MQSSESADLNVASPEQQVASPEQQVASPEQQVASPEQQVASPEQQVASPEQQVVPDSVDVGVKALTQLNTLMEESLQIYELEDQKMTVIDDLHDALQIITQFLGFSINIHPAIFNLPSDSTITLLPNLKLIIKSINGKTETKRFTDYTPEIITQIVEYATPKLLELIQTKKSYLTEKITFLRTATKQLNTLNQLKENIPTTITTEE